MKKYYRQLLSRVLDNYPNEDKARTTRLFNIGLILAVSGIFYSFSSILVECYPAIIIDGAFGFIMLFSPILFLRKVALQNIGLIYNVLGFFVVTSIAFITGGLHSPTIFWVLAPPMFTYLVIGKKWAWIFTVATVLFVVLLTTLHLTGYVFLELYNSEMYISYITSCFIGLMLFLCLLGFIFDTDRRNAFSELRKSEEVFNSKNLELKSVNAELEIQGQKLEDEKMRSDNLLANILPMYVADELKNTGKASARKFDDAIVMFTDFVGFSKVSKSMAPKELLALMEFYWKKFDEIIDANQLEKIKTIGDAYLCVGGLSKVDQNHIYNAMNAALSIQAFLEENKQQCLKNEEVYFEARIGLHTGPITAGVIGKTKFAYDIWGTAVNMAEILEESSERGKINISDHLFNRIKDDYDCLPRGEYAHEDHGNMNLYFVEGLKSN